MFKKYLAYAIAGTAMGYLLARIGFANYDEINKMFVFSDLRMFLSFAGAVGIVMVAAFALKKHIPRQDKFIQPGTLPGSMLFGCLVFVQLGQGKISALITLLGIYLGVVFYRKMHAKYFLWAAGSCNSA
jgi:hypothetical protein